MLTPEAKTLVRFALRLAISEIQHVQGQRKLEMHRMTPNATWTLNSQKYSIYTKYLPLKSKFFSVLLLFSRFWDTYKVAENRKCTQWPQTELEHLTVKSLYIHYMPIPEAQILARFALRSAFFMIQGRQKSEMHWMTSGQTLNT